jgi:hypothetical protein
VYTDYALLAEELSALGAANNNSGGADHTTSFRVEVAPSPADGGDVLWLNQPLRDFAALPRGLWVNQFPFEACLVRKDLLPQTCRAAAAAGWPPWAPPSYDLATEAAAFLAAHDAAGGDGAATWVVKRAGGTHSADAAVTRCGACVARHALARQLPGGDRVAQRHCDVPALLRGRKFDVRVYGAQRQHVALVAVVLHQPLAARPVGAEHDRYRSGAVVIRVVRLGQDLGDVGSAVPARVRGHEQSRLMLDRASPYGNRSGMFAGSHLAR